MHWQSVHEEGKGLATHSYTELIQELDEDRFIDRTVVDLIADDSHGRVYCHYRCTIGHEVVNLISLEVDSSVAPGLPKHGCLAVDYLIKPNNW